MFKIKGKLKKISDLHLRVIHGPQNTEAFSDNEYFKEDKYIKGLSDAALNLICPSCFPVIEKRPIFPSRDVSKYDIRYPTIKKIIDQGELPTE